jgi:hypothetical protein
VGLREAGRNEQYGTVEGELVVGITVSGLNKPLTALKEETCLYERVKIEFAIRRKSYDRTRRSGHQSWGCR